MIRHSVGMEGSVDCLILPLFEDKAFEKSVKELDTRHNGILSVVKENKDFEGKKLQNSLLYVEENGITRVLLIGLGKEKELTIRRWKQVVGAAIKLAQKKKWQDVSLQIPEHVLRAFGAKMIAQETAIAIECASYVFDHHKEKDARETRIVSVHYFGLSDKKDQTQFEKGLVSGRAIAESVNDVRHLGNTPPSIMTPTFLAKHAETMAKGKKNLSVTVLSRPEIKKLGMGCLLGVSRGSAEEPKFIILEYRGGKSKEKPVVLVGKGITFDSGGLSLKPEAYMSDMKFDMLGAATVLGTIRAAEALGIKKNIVGLIPSCENMPGGEAYRPDDILTAMNGKTVLIKNTDAEGRLILADALSYAVKYEPKEVIDFATLTGACVVALGTERSGLFSEQESMVSKLLASSETVGEQLWRLPLGEEYVEAMTCDIADIQNLGGVGGPRYAGASTAAAFLQYFTDYPWAHIDLSSAYMGEKGNAYLHGGATGFGVQTMVAYLNM